jgi:hypothetical protein
LTGLELLIAAELDRAVLPEAVEVGRAVAQRLGGRAVLFYGSVLRTSDLDGLLDFYVLRDNDVDAGILSRHVWPDVSYQEVVIGGRLIRAKVASMTFDTFARAARGEMLDSTVWARFVQPSALIWTDGAGVRGAVLRVVADAAITAARFAALHGPARGRPEAFWRALFRATYATELRVEAPGREEQILRHDRARYETLLPLAWTAGDIMFDRTGDELSPRMEEASTWALASAWMRHEGAGKTLNVVRLVKAAFTFQGAARYAAWKIERHTGFKVAITPFRERHPIMAAPTVLWRLWRRPTIR